MCGVPSVKELNYCTNKPQSRRPVNWPFTAVLMTLTKTSLELWICLFGLEPLDLLRLAARILRYVCVERGAALHYLDLSPRFQNNDHSVERYHRRTVCIQITRRSQSLQLSLNSNSCKAGSGDAVSISKWFMHFTYSIVMASFFTAKSGIGIFYYAIALNRAVLRPCKVKCIFCFLGPSQNRIVAKSRSFSLVKHLSLFGRFCYLMLYRFQACCFL